MFDAGVCFKHGIIIVAAWTVNGCDKYQMMVPKRIQYQDDLLRNTS